MFTGIVEELGAVVAVTALEQEAARLTVRGPLVVADVRHGDSIAVNGVCLTVAERDGEAFTADVMKETLDRTSLGALAPGDPVNLERSATLGTRLGGHLVQGHVDGVGSVLRRVPAAHWDLVEISLPGAIGRYVVEKGSIAVDGVSLTVAALHLRGSQTRPGDGPDSFVVSLIPTTLELTTLGHRKPGDVVNLEVDVIAKYVERLLPGGTSP